VVIVAQLTFSLPLHLPRYLGCWHADLPSSVGQPFSAAHFFRALLQANSCVLQLRAFCFPGSIPHSIGFPPIKQPLALEAEALAFVCPRKNGAEKGDIFMSYLNSVTIVGFVGADPEPRQARNNGSKFTVLSVATQRSWKNTEDEWVSKVEWHRVAIFRPRLAEAVLNNIKKGAHVLVEGSLVSSTYDQPNSKGKKAKTSKITSWTIRADAVRRLDRGEPEPEAAPAGQATESDEPTF
jgi:single stranded DNA-binding protein